MDKFVLSRTSRRLGKNRYIGEPSHLSQQTSTSKNQPKALKSALTRLLKGETDVLADPRIIDALPAVVKQLTGKGRTKTAQALIQGLLAKLMESEQKQERSRIVEALARTGPAALPVIGRQVKSDAPWYFLATT